MELHGPIDKVVFKSTPALQTKETLVILPELPHAPSKTLDATDCTQIKSHSNMTLNKSSQSLSNKPRWQNGAILEAKTKEFEVLRKAALDYALQTREMLLANVHRKPMTKHWVGFKREVDLVRHKKRSVRKSMEQFNAYLRDTSIDRDHCDQVEIMLDESRPTFVKDTRRPSDLLLPISINASAPNLSTPLLMYQLPIPLAVARSLEEQLPAKPTAENVDPLRLPPLQLKGKTHTTASVDCLLNSAPSFQESCFSDDTLAYTQNRFAFYHDYEFLNKHEHRMNSNLTCLLLRNVDDFQKKDADRFSEGSVAIMVWNLFVHLRSLEVGSIVDSASALAMMQVMENPSIPPNKKYLYLRDIVATLHKRQVVSLKAMIGHMRRLSVAYGKDFIQGLSIAFGPLLLQQRIYAREGNVYISPLLSSSLTNSISSLHQTSTPSLNKMNSIATPNEVETIEEPNSSELLSDSTEPQPDTEPSVQGPSTITSQYFLDLEIPAITLAQDYGWDTYDPALLSSLVFEQESPLTSQDAVLECLIRYYAGIFVTFTE